MTWVLSTSPFIREGDHHSLSIHRVAGTLLVSFSHVMVCPSNSPSDAYNDPFIIEN